MGWLDDRIMDAAQKLFARKLYLRELIFADFADFAKNAKITSREIFKNLRFAKINSREMCNKLESAKINSREIFDFF